MDVNVLFDLVSKEINKEKMVQNVKEIGKWHRYTGAAGGEACVDHLLSELEKAGVPAKAERYQAFVSLPMDEGTELVLESGEHLRLIGEVYSKAVENLDCEMVYDHWSEQKKIYELEEKERLKSFRGKLVLTHSGGGDFAEKLFRAGAIGMIHISMSRGGYIHHCNIGAEWGTPSADAMNRIVSIPAADVSFEDGQMLIERLEQGETIKGFLTIRMESGVRNSRMVIADIPGKSENFILINGHYDSWYEGITDNATSDAIMLELARVFWKHREKLERSVRIAWWSGHSDARYAGSTWYCDEHLDELNKKYVADINLDLTGCKLAEQVRARTTCMEGEDFTASVIEEYTGYKAKPYIPMIRGGDQSFWGAHIPIDIMFKYEPVDEKRVSACPSGGPWWHTEQDTLDKLDNDILYRDALMNLKIACRILNSQVLPVEMCGFVEKMQGFLNDINASTEPDFDLTQVINAIEKMKPVLKKFEFEIKRVGSVEDDRIIKETAGELSRLVYTSGSPYQQDRSCAYAPFGVLKQQEGVNLKNVSEECYLFKKTEFKRACNRIIGQLEHVMWVMEQYLDRKGEM